MSVRDLLVGPELALASGAGGSGDGEDDSPMCKPFSYEATQVVYEYLGVSITEPAVFSEEGEVLRYGVVVVVDDYGEPAYEGRIGYLDDEEFEFDRIIGDEEELSEEEEENEPGCTYGIVYFDTPFSTSWTLVPLFFLREATVREAETWTRAINGPQRIEANWREFVQVRDATSLRGTPCYIPEPTILVMAGGVELPPAPCVVHPKKLPHSVEPPRPAKIPKTPKCPPTEAYKRQGYFYCVRLSPELPHRVKLGYSVNVESRMKSYRTANPTLDLLGVWKCRRLREKPMINSIMQEDWTHQVGTEVFDVDDVNALLTAITGTLGRPIKTK